jgi:hypothetical protein
MNIDVILNRNNVGSESFSTTEPERTLPRCHRCGGDLEDGFLIEHQADFAPAAPTLWQAGTLGRSFWSGVESEPARQRRVVARRCTRCGGLDLFVPEFEPDAS